MKKQSTISSLFLESMLKAMQTLQLLFSSMTMSPIVSLVSKYLKKLMQYSSTPFYEPYFLQMLNLEVTEDTQLTSQVPFTSSSESAQGHPPPKITESWDTPRPNALPVMLRQKVRMQSLSVIDLDPKMTPIQPKVLMGSLLFRLTQRPMQMRGLFQQLMIQQKMPQLYLSFIFILQLLGMMLGQLETDKYVGTSLSNDQLLDLLKNLAPISFETKMVSLQILLWARGILSQSPLALVGVVMYGIGLL